MPVDHGMGETNTGHTLGSNFQGVKLTRGGDHVNDVSTGTTSTGTLWTSTNTISNSSPETDALKERIEKMEHADALAKERFQQVQEKIKEIKQDALAGQTASEVRIAELEKEENNRKDIEYFQRNMRKALKIPEHVKLGWNAEDKLSRLEVGPNDILIVHLNVTDIPASRVEVYMSRAKESLRTIFEARGLKGRTLWIPTRNRETHFAVIGLNDREEHLARARALSIVGADKRRKPRPPCMG
jgi:hypothetical protein